MVTSTGHIVLSSEEHWRQAVALKRARAYADVVQTTGWSEQEVIDRYAGQWGKDGTFHEAMLHRAAEGGELIGWLEDDRLLGYAAVRLTPFCGDDGPLLCTTGDLLIRGDVTFEGKVAIAASLVGYGRAKGATVFDFQCDGDLKDVFETAGMRLQKVTMRLDPAR
jgi:hypothetical protein